MTVITDDKGVVQVVSLIPGVENIPPGWRCYFPAKCGINPPSIGTFYFESDWLWPLPGVDVQVPEGAAHQGSFGALRKYDIHSGVDLYCEPGQRVIAVEPGRVLAIEMFTGAAVGMPWWRETYAVYVNGASGMVVYGEIDPTVKVGQQLKAGDEVGTVMTVLQKDKGLPMTMLHLELHKAGTMRTESWKLGAQPPNTLMDPTLNLKHAYNGIKKTSK